MAFLGRRVFLAAVVVYLANVPFIYQVVTVFLSSLAIGIVALECKPFPSK